MHWIIIKSNADRVRLPFTLAKNRRWIIRATAVAPNGELSSRASRRLRYCVRALGRVEAVVQGSASSCS